MKTISTFVLICFAQLSHAQKSFFGVDAGINVANQRFVVSQPIIQGTSAYFFNNIARPSFGFFYHLNFSSQLGVRAGAQYMGLGCKNDGPPINIDYLSLPASLIYSANRHLSFTAGSYVSFRLNENSSGYHKNDFGFLFGVEHDVYGNFALAANYYLGVKNIILNDNNGSSKCTNRALQFTLIYKFKKKS